MKLLANRQTRSASCAPRAVVQRSALTVARVARPRFVAARTAEVKADAASQSEDVKEEPVEEPEVVKEAPLPQSHIEIVKAALESDEPVLDKGIVSEALNDLESEVEILTMRLADAEADLESVQGSTRALTIAKDQLMRLTADFDNFRRRTADEKLSLKDTTRGDMMLSLLPIMDTFELARENTKTETEGEKKIYQSFQGIYRNMVDIMKGLGLEKIETENGAIFNPELHEAIMQEPSDDVPDGSILMEFRKGFKMGDRLLRPSMVKVSVSESGGAGPVTSSEE